MIDKKYNILINKAIDGDLSVEDERRLMIYLEQYPEARNLLEDLKQTSELLNETPTIDPPSGLKKRILNEIDFSCYTEQSKAPFIKSLIPEWLFAPRAKLAYAFILGLFFSAIVITPYLLSLSQKEEIDPSHLSGTIKKIENINFNIIHSIPIDRSGISGKINIKKFQYSNIIEHEYYRSFSPVFSGVRGTNKPLPSNR